MRLVTCKIFTRKEVQIGNNLMFARGAIVSCLNFFVVGHHMTSGNLRTIGGHMTQTVCRDSVPAIFNTKFALPRPTLSESCDDIAA